MDKQTYLKILTEQIRCKKALPLAAGELETHIEEQKTDYMAQGMPEPEAEEEAVRQMGDPVEVGIELDRLHRPKMAWGIIGGIVLLSLTGVCLLYVLQLHFKDQGIRFFPGQGSRNLLLYLLEITIGVGIMIGVCYIDYSRIGRYAKKIMAVYILFLIICKLGLGATINGTADWIALPGGLNMTLSTMMFLTVPLYGAVLYQYRECGYRGIIAGILWIIVPVLFVLQIPRIFQALLLALSFLTVLSTAVLKGWFRVKKGLTLTVLWGTAILVPFAEYAKIMLSGASYQKARIYSMFPFLFHGNAETAIPGDYQSLTLRELTSGSQIMGISKTLEHTAKSLPDGMDFVLAYVLSYYGILAALLLTGAVVSVFLKLFSVSIRQKNQLGMLMGTGCTIIFLLQILTYVMVNLGWMPVTSVYCPFITYGGTGILVTYMMLGLLLSIYRHQNILAEPKPHITVHKTSDLGMLS